MKKIWFKFGFGNAIDDWQPWNWKSTLSQGSPWGHLRSNEAKGFFCLGFLCGTAAALAMAPLRLVRWMCGKVARKLINATS